MLTAPSQLSRKSSNSCVATKVAAMLFNFKKAGHISTDKEKLSLAFPLLKYSQKKIPFNFTECW